ncbi:hypothetical protein F5Y19DRAFT_491813 [Xylariaceae sp. FL1651]|nr:hypothetical protein F5Y19DRAFT_491813 [Xylariaceae sp. FL1651]
MATPLRPRRHEKPVPTLAPYNPQSLLIGLLGCLGARYAAPYSQRQRGCSPLSPKDCMHLCTVLKACSDLFSSISYTRTSIFLLDLGTQLQPTTFHLTFVFTMSDNFQGPFYWEPEDDSWLPDTIDPALLQKPAADFDFDFSSFEQQPVDDSQDLAIQASDNDLGLSAPYDFFFAHANS